MQSLKILPGGTLNAFCNSSSNTLIDAIKYQRYHGMINYQVVLAKSTLTHYGAVKVSGWWLSTVAIFLIIYMMIVTCYRR